MSLDSKLARIRINRRNKINEHTEELQSVIAHETNENARFATHALWQMAEDAMAEGCDISATLLQLTKAVEPMVRDAEAVRIAADEAYEALTHAGLR